MTNNSELVKTLWNAVDKLRSNSNIGITEYKHIVLGLIFLKHTSDAFDKLYQIIDSEKKNNGKDPEDKGEYTAGKVFYVPPKARWEWLQERATLPAIGKNIDDAMNAIEKENPYLKDVLPKDYARPAIDKQLLSELIERISSISSSNNGNEDGKDGLGFIFEYFLDQFALAEGKVGGELYTPRSIAKLMVEMLAPESAEQVYDGCCGSGEMFIQIERFIEFHEHRRNKISIFGQEKNQTAFRLAKMRLSIWGIDANIELGDTLVCDNFPELKVDYILSNPPFNVSNYQINKAETQKWKYGIPPTGNANYAWLQLFISKLGLNGIAGLVMAPSSTSSTQKTEWQIRKNLIENDLIDCIVLLPSQLFYHSQLPACLWFLSRNKINHKFRNREHEILFIDAREMGTMINRKQKELMDEDIRTVTDTYHHWLSKEWQEKYKDIPGFCKSTNIEEIRNKNYVITPGLYIDLKENAEDDQAFDEKMLKLTETLREQMHKSQTLDEQIKVNLKKVGYEL